MTSLIVSRARAIERLRLREKAHAEVDKAFDLYEEGAPLHIVCQMSWTSDRVDDGLRVTILPRRS